MKTLYIFLIIIFSFSTSIAQKEAYNWDFGGPNVITFNTPDGEPAILMPSVMRKYSHKFVDYNWINWGSSAISDSTGKFLFSSDGVYLYNYSNDSDYMLFNDSLLGLISNRMFGFHVAQYSSVITKLPGNNNIYYIFTSHCYCSVNNILDTGYYYSVVDMSKNDGKGAIVSINNPIYSPTSGQLRAIRHANGKDYWIITHKYNSRQFFVYLFNENGLNIETPIISSTNLFFPIPGILRILRSNLKGDLLVNSVDGNTELLKFDKMTGKISSLIDFKIDSLYIYDIEFSPDNSKLYVLHNYVHGFEDSIYKNNIIYQYEISKMDVSSILDSKKIIYENNPEYKDRIQGWMYGLQLAPNGKIYVARDNTVNIDGVLYSPGDWKLSAINKPNLSGDSCEFSLSGTKIISSGSHWGFPNFPTGIFDFDVKISSENVCDGDELVLTAHANPDITVNKYTWLLPDGSERTGKTIKISNTNQKHSGLYKVTVDINSTIREDSIMIEIYPKPLAKISGNLSFCKNGSTTLSANNGNSYKYKWSTGETTQSITVKNEGRYILTVENENGCKASDTVNVIYSSDLEFDMVAQTKLCTGDTLMISTNLIGNDFNFDWSTGEKIPQILITKGGKYVLKVRTDAGCEGMDSVIIEEFEKPEVTFEKSFYQICEGEKLTIKPIKIDSKYNYIWSDGNSEPERTLTESTELYLIASLENGCSDTAFVKIEVLENPIAKITATETEVCYGNKITLTAENYNPKFQYLWSTGETSESISVSESGTYRLIAGNGNLCADTAEIEVKIYPDLALELLADKTNLCFDDFATISTKQNYAEYLWSTGETTPSITVKDAGIYKLIVKNEFGCADTSEIEIFKYDANIEFDKEKLTFDDLCVGETQTKNIEIRIKTETEFKISDVSISSNSFEIINKNALLKSYKNGEIVNIEIKFTPQDAGIFDDELVISSTEPCEFTKIIPISASAKQVLEFSFGEHYSEAGQLIEIPLFGQIKCPAPQNLTTDYEIEIAFDKEYFAAESVKYGQVISNEIVGIEKIIKVKADGSFNQSKSEINVIYGKALLGRSESSQIRINEVKLSKDRYFQEHLNGSLTVDGCVNDITTIQMFTPTKMTISPNPSDGELKVSIGTQEEGSFRLVIFDVQGREVYRSEFTRNERTFEQKDYNINTQNLGNGIYTIHLTAPWTLLREQVVVVR